MGMYAYLGDINSVKLIFDSQKSIDIKSVSLLSMHLLMVSHLNFYENECQFQSQIYSLKNGGKSLTDNLSEIVSLFPSYLLSPNRITYDLLINGGALCDDKSFILSQIYNLSNYFFKNISKFVIYYKGFVNIEFFPVKGN